MGSKAPKAPDPAKVSAAQTQSNQDTALFNANLNRVNQTSPFGAINWSHTGDDPATGWSQSTTLSPALQGLFDSQIGAQQGISSAITGALGNLPTGPFDAGDINVDDVRQRSFDSQMANLTPQFEKGWRDLEGTLSDRGIPIGAEIWNDQLGEYNRAKDSSLLAASRQADQDASNEFQRQYGNKLTEYQMPLQTLSALMGNSQAVGNPQFSPFPQSSSATTDTAGNIWKAYEANAANAQNDSSNTMQAILGAAKLGTMFFSDIRLKRNIERVGALPYGLPVYQFTYLWSDEPEIGVMAQDVLHYRPEAVAMHDSGYLMVDYGLL